MAAQVLAAVPQAVAAVHPKTKLSNICMRRKIPNPVYSTQILPDGMVLGKVTVEGVTYEGTPMRQEPDALVSAACVALEVQETYELPPTKKERKAKLDGVSNPSSPAPAVAVPTPSPAPPPLVLPQTKAPPLILPQTQAPPLVLPLPVLPPTPKASPQPPKISSALKPSQSSTSSAKQQLADALGATPVYSTAQLPSRMFQTIVSVLGKQISGLECATPIEAERSAAQQALSQLE